ncbi:hypothetical protein DVH24_019505 [Malus domestica]|uniref:F-box domain-containing protein n=1 Tax=Malus domestica TaxID=3750 RepID=A0A498I3X1_MALDO|nr:hypothetical protein DVH24_019505 [Malus domestica]
MKGVGFSNLDDNLIFKVFKHVDARMLGMALCVSRQWHKMMEDERLRKLICTRHYQQLRYVVVALGGFRRLHAYYIWRLSKAFSSSSSVISFSSTVSSFASPWATASGKPMLNLKSLSTRWRKG